VQHAVGRRRAFIQLLQDADRGLGGVGERGQQARRTDRHRGPGLDLLAQEAQHGPRRRLRKIRGRLLRA
jgi:hypothetical protein